MNLPCWIWPIITGIICAILGYLLGRMFASEKDNSDEINIWKQKNSELDSDLKTCKSKRNLLETALADCRANLSATQRKVSPESSSIAGATSTSFDKNAVHSTFKKNVTQDDLKIVEGIGPKIEALFHNHEIKTWKALSECSVEKCQQVLNSGGKRFGIHKPATWPKQAKFAYEGKWAALLAWQDALDGGK